MVVRRADFSLPPAPIEAPTEPVAKKPPEAKQETEKKKGWLARDPRELKRKVAPPVNIESPFGGPGVTGPVVDPALLMKGLQGLPGGSGFAPASQPRGQVPVTPGMLAGTFGPTGQERVAQYLANVKTQLAAAGLPTRAPHARIALIEEAFENNGALGPHGQMVARAMAGPIGLAQGAEIRYSNVEPKLTAADSKALDRWVDTADRVTKGQGTLGELAKAYVASVPAHLRCYDDALQSASKTLPASEDGRARLFLNLSNGVNLAQPAKLHANAIAANRPAPGTPLYRELTRRLGPPGTDGGWNPEQVANLLRDDMREAMKGSQDAVDAARADLGKTVQRLRKEGVVVFASTGNDADWAGAHPNDTFNFNAVPGIIRVGGSDIGDPNDPRDDRVAKTSTGARGYTTLTTVGQDIPLGPNGELVGGTSFSTPIAVSIAALMTEANPKLTPDDIENILTDRRVAKDLPGDRDGAGQVDPVAAVKLARTWLPRS